MRKGGLLTMGSFQGGLEVCGAGAKARVRRCKEFCLSESESLVNSDSTYSLNCIVTSIGH